MAGASSSRSKRSAARATFAIATVVLLSWSQLAPWYNLVIHSSGTAVAASFTPPSPALIAPSELPVRSSRPPQPPTPTALPRPPSSLPPVLPAGIQSPVDLHGGNVGSTEQRQVAATRATSQCLRSTDAVASETNDDAARDVISYDLVVLILSSRQKELNPLRRREAVRRSWAHTSSELGVADASAAERCSLRHVFVVGGSKKPAHLWSHDVLVLPVADGYRQIVHKVIGALRWLIGSLPFKYVLKTDDDSFVCTARLLELLRPLPRRKLYLGVINPHHKVITSGPTTYERWRDSTYVELFNRTVYAPYMQGAGYVLSADLAALSVERAVALPTLPAVEDALIGTLVEDEAMRVSRPSGFRAKNRDDYAVTVCEGDTEFVLLHKLSEDELSRCFVATQRRRSERCPRGPCECRSLGYTFQRPHKVIASFAQAADVQAARQRTRDPTRRPR